jgi:outer membrane protein assembly factor BamE (lipoprotein component of BamABCDE complex)
MKLAHLSVLIAFAFLLAACGDDETTQTPHSAQYGHHERSGDDDQTEPSEKHPRVGMTENQVREMYGDPDNVNHSSNGEVWQYWFNKGHAFIPYNFGYKARTGTFIFNDAGRLTSFDYNE